MTKRGLDSAGWTTSGSNPFAAIQVVADDRKLSMPPGISPYLFVVTRRIEAGLVKLCEHTSVSDCVRRQIGPMGYHVLS